MTFLDLTKKPPLMKSKKLIVKNPSRFIRTKIRVKKPRTLLKNFLKLTLVSLMTKREVLTIDSVMKRTFSERSKVKVKIHFKALNLMTFLEKCFHKCTNRVECPLNVKHFSEMDFQVADLDKDAERI